MANHIKTGKDGEDLAAEWLSQNGYNILHRNWRYSFYEIDAIATKDNFLHFIEVKARNYTRFDHPENSVTTKKFKSIQKAADEYLFQHPGHPWIQYNILSVTIHGNGNIEFFLIEDVFL